VVEQTALFCGMRWEPPLVFHGAHRAAEQTLDEAADDYRQRVERLLATATGGVQVAS
jgi:putative NADPH-quinone reductase